MNKKKRKVHFNSFIVNSENKIRYRGLFYEPKDNVIDYEYLEKVKR